jgi:class 3 adenylate cyclase
MSQVLEESPLQAGREAVARHAWREGFQLLSEADNLQPLGPDDLVALAESAWWTGRLEDCIEARERAYALYLEEGQPRKAAVTALAVAQDYFGKLAHSIGAGWFNRAERLLKEEGDCAEQGHLSMAHAMSASAMGDHDSALKWGTTTLEVGTRFGDRDLQAYGLLLQGKALVSKGQVKEGLALLDEATVAAVSGEIGPYASGIIYCVAISSTSKLADYQRAGEWTEASRRWCERQSISGFPGVCRVHRAAIMRLRGSWAEAESDARRAITELQGFQLEFAAEGFYEIGEIRLRMGDLDEARDAFRQAHELGREPQPGLAMLQLAEGKAQAAMSSLKRALEDDRLDRLGRCRLLIPLVPVAIAAGDIDAAHAAADEAQAIASEFESPVLQASALCSRGELQLAEGDAKAALQSLRDAWRMWRAADLPYEGARARMLLGVALRECEDEEAAVLELQAARGAFEKLGAVLDLRKTLELLGEEVAQGLPKASAPGSRVTKAFMFTDIVSSTNLVEAIGDEAWENVLAWHDQTMRQLFMTHCGEEVKHVGDGFFVAFDEAAEAVECAADIQRQLAEHRKEHGFAPQVRIGLHLTDATRKGNDYGGKGVHAAARIGALAQGGEIVASRKLVEAAKPRFPFSEFRSVELKGVAEPVEVASMNSR